MVSNEDITKLSGLKRVEWDDEKVLQFAEALSIQRTEWLLARIKELEAKLAEAERDAGRGQILIDALCDGVTGGDPTLLRTPPFQLRPPKTKEAAKRLLLKTLDAAIGAEGGDD